ncbi:MAG: PilZ domain-containing protein [Gammaproteobacteria bacterium]|nr:PilZ domain-containing protein [Gammaproteobacteria bacterium]
MTSQERRANRRKKTAVNVYITSRENPIKRFVARNLSIGGLFLEMERLEVPVNTTFTVFVTVAEPDTSVIRVHPLASRVIHWAPDGVGLKFCKKPRYMAREAGNQSAEVQAFGNKWQD